MLHAEINAQCLQHLSGDTYLLCPDPAWLFSPQGGFPEQSVSSFREARGCGGRMQCQLQQHQQQRLEEGLTAHLLFCRTSVLLSYPAINFSHCYILNQSWSLCVTVPAGLRAISFNTIQDCCASRRGEHRGSCCSLGPRGPVSLLYTISPVLGAATCFSTEAQEYLFPACTASLRCCLPSTDAASHLHLSRMSSGGKAALRDRGADHSRS